MSRLQPILLAAMAFLFVALHAESKARTPETKPTVLATLSAAADGNWILTYRFSKSAPAWFFTHSNPAMDDQSWRLRSWTVLTPGVALERVGRYDVVKSGNGKPFSQLRIKVVPYGDHLKAEYVPFLKFSDGGVAIFSEHYQVAPLPTAAAAAEISDNLNRYPVPATRLTIKAPGKRMLVNGAEAKDAVSLAVGAGAYVYTGNAPVTSLPALSAVLDPALPTWFRNELADFTPRLFNLYTERLGKPGGVHPVAYVAWGGPKRSGITWAAASSRVRSCSTYGEKVPSILPPPHSAARAGFSGTNPLISGSVRRFTMTAPQRRGLQKVGRT
jgi:hypothetical protein